MKDIHRDYGDYCYDTNPHLSMQITIPNILRIFSKYNSLCFDGKLPLPGIKLGNAKNYLGQLRYKTRKDSLGHIHRYDYTLCVNTRYEMDERSLEDTIIHEMIHYYIAYNNIQDTSSHGVAFRKIMDDINSRFGRNITVSTKGSELSQTDTPQYKQYVVCVATLQDGSTAAMVCARTRIFEVDDTLPLRYPIRDRKWYFTIDPYFNRFPRSNSAKLYRADKEELSQHLSTALRLERKGQVFQPQK